MSASPVRIHGLDDAPLEPALMERLSLCEALDRVLNKGAVIAAEAVVSVAGVDLLYLQLRLLLSSVETLHELAQGEEGPP